MIKISCTGANAELLSKEPITTGAQQVFRVVFEFDSSWEGLTKTAVFKNSEKTISVLLDKENSCIIPHEVLTLSEMLYAGVYGVGSGTVVLPTVWCALGYIRKGTVKGDNATDPTPSIYNQLVESAQGAAKEAVEAAKKSEEAVNAAEKSLQLAEEIKQAAANGEFDGNLLYATFKVDPESGILFMYYSDEYGGPDFKLNDGYLEVNI